MSKPPDKAACSETDAKLCPTCRQPLPSPPPADNETPAAKRQKTATPMQKKLRSADPKSPGCIKKWEPGTPCYVNIYDKAGNQGWEPGFVHHTEPPGIHGEYKIVAHIEHEGEWGAPSSVNPQNCDPIPSFKPNDPSYKLSDHLLMRDERLDGVSELLVKHFKCIQYHSASDFNVTLPEQDVVGKLLLDEDQTSPTSIRNLLQSLTVSENVKRIVKEVTGEEECLVQHALAYILGQLCGIELCESSVADEVDPSRLMDKIGSATDDSVDCPISQVFLMSAMLARTKRWSKDFNPRAELYDSRAKDVLTDPIKLRVRKNRLKTALAAIHSSQRDQPSITGPSFALLSHGIQLMIDMKGTSDAVLDKLAEDGICRPAKVLRQWIHKLADSINPSNSRSQPPPGMSRVVANTFDNADFHVVGNCVSVVACGDIQLGLDTTDNIDHFNKHYMTGLGEVSETKVDQLLATKQDDEYAQDVMDNQNIFALLTATESHDWISNWSLSGHSSGTSRPRPRVGSKVAFTWRSEEREGTVKSTSSGYATIEFSDGGSIITRKIELDKIHGRNGTSPERAATVSKNKSEKKTPEMFDGERHRFAPSTTDIISVLTGVDSKNKEAAQQVLQDFKLKLGYEKFYGGVNIMVCDQEFMPTIIAEFFSKLQGEDKLPILPVLAIGHAMKGLSVSMMTYYQCFFDPMMESMGIKVGSPEHSKLYKGTEIRKTNALVTNFTENLAVAAAHKYLLEVGNDNRIEIEGLGMRSPLAIINAHYASECCTSRDPTDKQVVVMDPYTRPIGITVTRQLKLVARDFQRWAKKEYGTTTRDEIGPSGYERKSSNAMQQEPDPEQQQLLQYINQHPIYIEQYRDMNYTDDGENPGLLTRCRQANLRGKSHRNDRDTLSKKLFILEVMKDREKAVKFGQARKFPKGLNSTALALYDLLFGVERSVLVLGHLLTRVRPEDKNGVNNGNGGKKESTYQDMLVFFKALTTSNFMRRQPNYQRLSLSFLIQLTMILNHDDQRCTEIALKYIRWCFSVSEWGDSHNCQPVDLLQEFSLVAQTKRIGSRSPHACNNLEDRVKVQGRIRLGKVASREFTNTHFGQISPDRAAKAIDQRRMSHSIVLFWVSILGDIQPFDDDANAKLLDKIQGIGNEDKSELHLDRSRGFWRCHDAIAHIRTAAAAFKKGFELGLEVQLTKREFPILCTLHRSVKRQKPKEQILLVDLARSTRSDAEQSLTEEGYVKVSASSSMLNGVAKAGENKAVVYPAVISIMSKNKPFAGSSGQIGTDEYQIGDGPHQPIYLSRTDKDATRSLMERAVRTDCSMAPIFRIIDLAKDLHCFVPKRNGGNTVNELARDILCEAIEKYCFPGIEMLCLAMDVADCMTTLRLIPHAKRGKLDGIKIPHGMLSKVKKGTDDLTPYGARSDLLTCGDKHFLDLLFNCVCNQAKLLENEGWKLHRQFQKFSLAIVGGSTQACVVVGIGGKETICLNTQSIVIPCKDVEDAFERDQIMNTEEGEIIIYAIMGSLFKLGFTHQNKHEGIDCIMELHSDDSDTMAGLGMQATYNLESTCLNEKIPFFGAIFLRGPKKSVPQISKLGDIFATNMEVDQQLCPTGKGFVFFIDLIAVYYCIEQDNSLPKLPPGHRAISLVAVIYTMINNDYLRMASYGLTYSKLIAAMKSVSYKQEVQGYEPELISPARVDRQSVFVGETHDSQTGYNLPGVLILLHHAFINRPRTKKKLLEMYKPEQLGVKLPFNVVRAAAILAEEVHPVPDPIALLCHLSCANLIFRRWTVVPGDSSLRTDDELKSTCYVLGEVKGQRVVSIEYNLRSMAKKRNEALDDESLLKRMKLEYFGSSLLPSINVGENTPMPFVPFDEIKTAIKYQGLYPTVKVPGELLPKPAKETDTEKATTNLIEEHDLIDTDDDESDEESDEDIAASDTLFSEIEAVANEIENEVEDNEY